MSTNRLTTPLRLVAVIVRSKDLIRSYHAVRTGRVGYSRLAITVNAHVMRKLPIVIVVHSLYTNAHEQ